MTRYLLISTPVGPLGSGIGGGVELNLANLARQLVRCGHVVHVLAPEGSQLDGIPLTAVAGLPPAFAQAGDRHSPIHIPLPSVLANMWQLAARMAPEFDVTVNWAYDWLPLYLTPWFRCPVAHIISMASLHDGLDLAIAQVRRQFPGTVAVHSRAQAATFPPVADAPFAILPCGIPIADYDFVAEPEDSLCWVGRIAPEKGLEDCAALSQQLNQHVVVMGTLQDEAYWQQIQTDYPRARLDYRGFLPTDRMQQVLGRSRALVMTPKWVEAFGMVAVEALACGVPVLTYDRGGPAEIVLSGETGWVVESDRIDALADAARKLDAIDRRACRQRAIEHYSLEVMQHTFEQWIATILASWQL